MRPIPCRRPLASVVTVLSTAAALVAQAPIEPVRPDSQSPPPGERAEAPQEPKKERVVVTASGFREEALETPFTFQQVDQSDIQERGFRTLPESLAQVPGVMVQKTAHGHGSPYIRGFTGRQNLILIDGIRFNNSVFRGGPVQYWNTIDPFTVDYMDVVKSQGSVLYGSDAIGGTVNVITKSSNFRDHAPGGTFCHGEAFYRFDTNGRSHTARLENSIGEGGSWGVHAGVTYRDFGDIRDRVLGTMENTGYDEYAFDVRFDIALGAKTTLTAAHQRVRQENISRTHRTVDFEAWQGTSLGSPDLARIYDQWRELSYVRVAGERLGGAIDEYRFTLSYQSFEEDFERTRLRGGGNVESQFDNTQVGTFGAALAMESKIGAGRVVYGFDYYRDDVDARTHVLTFDPSGTLLSNVRSVQGPVGDDAFYDLAGVYVQGRAPVGDDVEVTAGARYTYAEARIGTLDDGGSPPAATSANRDWDQLTFNLRGNARVADNLHVYGGASQAFRAPNLDDLSALKSSRTDIVSTGSLNIEPEEYLTYEVGTRYIDDEVSVQAAVFYTDVSDQITSRPVGTVPGTGEVITASTNGSDGWLWGGEIQASVDLDRQWTASGFLAYVDGEEDAFPTADPDPVREPVSRLMPVTGSLALRWTDPMDKVWVEGRVIAAGRAGRLNTADRGDTSRFPPDGTPRYVVAFLSGGVKVSEHVDVLLTLENITDTSYRIHGSGVNQPGFNAILGGRISW